MKKNLILIFLFSFLSPAVYNQPDYSLMKPYEFKQVKQYWYPLREIKGVKSTNQQAAVNLSLTSSETVFVASNTTGEYNNAKVTLVAKNNQLFTETINIVPDKPFIKYIKLLGNISETDIKVSLYTAENEELISYNPDSLEIHLGQAAMAGEVTDTTAILQARLTATEKPLEGDMPGTGGIARFEISRDTGFTKSILTHWRRALPEQDYIVRENITGLQPGTQYYYRLIWGKTAICPKYGKTGRFSTLPGKEVENPVKLVVVTGMNYNNFYFGPNGDPNHPVEGAYSGKDKNSGYPALEAIWKIKPDYFIGTGDNVYYDQPGNEPYRATTLMEMRKKWHEQFSQPRFKELFRNVATYWEIDDHDYRYNDSDNTGEMGPSPALGRDVYLEQLPVIPPGSPDQPTYRSYSFNKYLQVWLTEGRFFRSPNNREDGPDKSLWGKEQLEWLHKTLLASDAEFKLIISPTPLVGPDDNYKSDNHTNPKGFRHEGDEFFAWLKEKEFSPAKLFFVCGDRHWQYHAKHQKGFEEFSCGALVDANSRAGRKAGDPESTDPDKKIIQHYIQTKGEASGGFLIIETLKENDYPVLLFRFCDENGSILYETKKQM